MKSKDSDKNDAAKEKRLLQGVRKGDKDSFSELFHIYYEDLCRFTLHYTGTTDVAEDIAQDVFLEIWQRRHILSIEGSIKSYLFKSARNSALNYIRHKKIANKWEQQVRRDKNRHRNNPENKIQNLETLMEIEKAIEEAIDQLPERRKLIFSLSRDEGLTYQEIAIVLNISVKTVETQIRRSKITLRELLTKYLPAIVLLASQNM